MPHGTCFPVEKVKASTILGLSKGLGPVIVVDVGRICVDTVPKTVELRLLVQKCVKIRYFWSNLNALQRIQATFYFN